MGKLVSDNFDIDLINEWKEELCSIALNIEKCLDIKSNVSSNSLVKVLLADKSEFLNFLKLKSSPLPADIQYRGTYNKWLIDIWGRKLKYYIGSLQNGIIQYNQLLNGINDEKTLKFKNISSFVRKFRNCYTDQNGRDNLSESIKRRLDINNHYHTYLDSHLFSVLLIYEIKKEKLDPDSLRDLKDLIINEVQKSIDYKIRKIHICDVSTLWWGIDTIVAFEGECFSLFQGRFKGCKGIAKICELIIEDSSENFRSPKYDMAKVEETPEIYEEYRTRLFIIMNAIKIMSKIKNKSVYETLNKYVSQNFDKLMNWKNEISSHIYFIGLGLEVLSLLIYHINNNGFNEEKFNL